MSRPREFDADLALRQCMDVFWAKGFKATSFEDLTRRTQVKKQSLYGAFEDKRSLYLQALALYRKQFIRMLEQAASQKAPVRKKLDDIRLLSLGSGEGGAACRGCLMVNAVLEFGAEDLAVSAEIASMSAEVERILEVVLREGQAQHIITTRCASRELAAYLSNVLRSAKVMERSGAGRASIDAVLQTSFALLEP
ncbi:TetR/AcrR family transcriptional regulator [Paenibacillus sp. IB182496]|uniref:TetR/AcrR family transcriptional regulator n=1 Tax=Paenibacillus sabuli TaxID=2772509 RepID=A0A927BPL6_9BACL|nr:TetR/AcrR family transcriptional regulator [Paenibacillus sabuli]MBD2843621.1 TetR/AcrR family transcriptional regulator [Paenibacillus sabuli]